MVPNSKGNPFGGVTNYKGGEKIWRFFFSEIAGDLGNGTRYSHGSYGTLIESHMRSIER